MKMTTTSLSKLIVVAGAVLAAVTAHAQTPPQMAQQGLSWFSWYLTNGQINGGEDIGEWYGDQGMVWHDANTTEMLADYTIATGDQTYVSNLQAYKGYDGRCVFGNCGQCFGLQIFGGCVGVQFSFGSPVNDDKLWWALAMVRIYDLLGDSAYLGNAETIFGDVCQYWAASQGCGGGVTWEASHDGGYLNAVTNELFFETAAKLAARDPGRQSVCGSATPSVTSPGGKFTRRWPNTYLGWAVTEWEWFKQYWFPAQTDPNGFGKDWPPAAGLSVPIPDGLGNHCVVGAGHMDFYTYNQGVILGALIDLASLWSPKADNIVPDTPETLIQFALLIATRAMSTLSEAQDGARILTEVPDSGGNNGCGPPDCPEFKGVFMRYLGRLVARVSYAKTGCFVPSTLKFLDDNAKRVFQLGLADGGIFPEKWNALVVQSTTPQSEGYWLYQPAMTSALDAIIADIQRVDTSCGTQGKPCCCAPAPECGGEASLACQLGSCVHCGNDGEPCCAGGATSACNSHLVCERPGQCVPCGQAGQPCCSSPVSACDTTYPRLVCLNSQCTVCGADGQPCCDASSCNNDTSPALTCSDGSCSCGGAMGQICIRDGDCCSGSCQRLRKLAFGTCSCTGSEGPCKSGDECCSGACNANSVCACAAVGKPCSNDVVSGHLKIGCCGQASCQNGICHATSPGQLTCQGIPIPTSGCENSQWKCCTQTINGKPSPFWMCGQCPARSP
jgi:hypothetical protein